MCLCLILFIQWSVFSCGHCICCQCAWVLLRQAGIGPRHRNVHVKCPMCRIPTIAHEISYVSTERSQTKEADENVTVKVFLHFILKIEILIILSDCHTLLLMLVLRIWWYVKTILPTSDALRRWPEHFRRLPKMNRRLPKITRGPPKIFEGDRKVSKYFGQFPEDCWRSPDVCITLILPFVLFTSKSHDSW